MKTPSWGGLIRKWRLESGISQSDLGSKVGFSGGVIGAIERGKRTTEDEELVLLCRALGKDPADALDFLHLARREAFRRIEASIPVEPEQSPPPRAGGYSSKAELDEILDELWPIARRLFHFYRENGRPGEIERATLKALSLSDTQPARARAPRKRKRSKGHP